MVQPLGHFTYECKSSRPYISRPSRTQQLENPRVLSKLKADGKPSVDVPEEFKNKYGPLTVFDLVQERLMVLCRSGTANRILEAKEKERAKDSEGGKKKRSRYVVLRKAYECTHVDCRLAGLLQARTLTRLTVIQTRTRALVPIRARAQTQTQTPVPPDQTLIRRAAGQGEGEAGGLAPGAIVGVPAECAGGTTE